MGLKKEINDYLKADPGLSALVSTRIFPDSADQKTARPYITWEDQSQQSTHHLTGVSSSGLARITVQFSIWAKTAKSRSDVEKALRQALDGKNKQYFGAVWINHIIYTNGVDTFSPGRDGSQDNSKYGKFMDFEIWHEREV